MYDYECVKIGGKKYDVHRLLAGATDLGFNFVVHHIDGNKRNNDLSNLEIMTRAEHCKLHGFGTTIRNKRSFDPNEDGTFTCRKCKRSMDKSMFLIHKKEKYGIESTCKECNNRIRKEKKRRGVE